MTETSTLSETNQKGAAAIEEPVSFCGNLTAATVAVAHTERSLESPEGGKFVKPDFTKNDRHNQEDSLQIPMKLPVEDVVNSSRSPADAFPSSPTAQAIDDKRHQHDPEIGCDEPPPDLQNLVETPKLPCVPITPILASNIHQQQGGTIPKPNASNGSLSRTPVMKRPRHKPGERRELLERAVEDVLTLNISMRRAAQKHNLAKSSLCDYVRKNKILLPNLRFKSLPNSHIGSSTTTPASTNSAVTNTHSLAMKRTASDVTLDLRSDSNAFSSLPAKMVCSTMNRVLTEHDSAATTPISYSEGEDNLPDGLLKPAPSPSISFDLLNHHHHRASPMTSTGGQLEADYLFSETGHHHRLFLQQSPTVAAAAAAVAISRTPTPCGQSLAKAGRIESPWHNAAGLPTQVPIRSWSGLSGSCAAAVNNNNTTINNNNTNLVTVNMANPDRKAATSGGGRQVPTCVHPADGLALASSTAFLDSQQHRDLFSPVFVTSRKTNSADTGCDTGILTTSNASRLDTEGSSNVGPAETSAGEQFGDKNSLGNPWSSERSYTLSSGDQGFASENTSTQFEECQKSSSISCSLTDTTNSSYHSEFSTGLGTNRSSPVVGLSQLCCSSTEQPSIPSVFPSLSIRQQLSRGDLSVTATLPSVATATASSSQQDYSSGQLSSDSQLHPLSVGGGGSVQASYSTAASDTGPTPSSGAAQASHGCASLPSFLSNSSDLQSFSPATIAALLFQQSRNLPTAGQSPALFGCVNSAVASSHQGHQPQHNHQHHPYPANTCQLVYSSAVSNGLPVASLLPDLGMSSSLPYSSLAALTGAGLPSRPNSLNSRNTSDSLNSSGLTDLTTLSELLQTLKPDDARLASHRAQQGSAALPVQPRVATQDPGTSQLTALLVGLLLHHWSSQAGHSKTPATTQLFNGQLNSRQSESVTTANHVTPDPNSTGMPPSQLSTGFETAPRLDMSQQTAAATALVDFINKSPSPFHAVQTACDLLARHGFRELKETEAWTVSRGDRVFLVKNGTTLVAAAVGGKFEPGNGLNILSAHTDSPCLRLKPASERVKEGYIQVGVETYGGGIWYSWFDRELKVAGRVLVTDPLTKKLEQRLVHIDQPIACVPSLAIHLDRESNTKGFNPNSELHLAPVLCTTIMDQLKTCPTSCLEQQTAREAKRRHPIALIRLLAERLGVCEKDMVEFELFFADCQPARLGGIHSEFIHAPRLDNLFNSYTAIQGLVKTLDSLDVDPAMRVVCLFDHEEVGSLSAQGADAGFTGNILRRLVNAVDFRPKGDTVECFEQSLGRSFLISADQSHAVHPAYTERYEEGHKPQMHGGVVLKYNCNQAYATNSLTAAVLRRIAEMAHVPVQDYTNRQDIPCGSTIGPILSAQLGVATVDVGFPQLAMHSCRELGSASSVEMAVNLYAKFFEQVSTIWPPG